MTKVVILLQLLRFFYQKINEYADTFGLLRIFVKVDVQSRVWVPIVF